jgi:uncharacterized protein
MNWLALLVILLALFAAIMMLGCGYSGLTREGSMSIWEAVEREDLDAIQAYVDRGGDLDVGASLRGKTPLLHAYIHKKKESYSKLLDLGANPNIICRGVREVILPHSSVVHHAALDDDPFWLRAALEAGADPDQMNGGKGIQKGRPLRFAIMNNRLENVRLLCQHNANIDAPMDFLGLTALEQAGGAAKFDIVHYLLEQGADFAEPRPVHEGNTFIYTMRQKKPEFYTKPEVREWCAAIWEWFRERGKDLEKARWNGAKWVWD